MLSNSEIMELRKKAKISVNTEDGNAVEEILSRLTEGCNVDCAPDALKGHAGSIIHSIEVFLAESDVDKMSVADFPFMKLVLPLLYVYGCAYRQLYGGEPMMHVDYSTMRFCYRS